MWKDAWFVGRNDLGMMLHRRETLLWTFLMPIVFFYFIGSITGGGSMVSGGQRLALEVHSEAGFLGQELVQRLGQEDYTLRIFNELGELEDPASLQLKEGQAVPHFEDYSRRLRIPAGFTRDVLAGTPVKLQFEAEGEGLRDQLDAFNLKRAAYTVLADVLAAASLASESPESPESNADSGDPSALGPEAFKALHEQERSLRLEVSEAGKRKRIPNGFEQAVPGAMVMFTLLILLTSGASTLVVERREGLLRRLASAPMGRGSVVLGKWIGKFGLAAAQVGFAMLLGSLAFGVHWGPSLPMLILTLGSYAAMLSSLGILVGNLARTESQAVSIGVLSATVLGALGGCWWPIEVTGRFMQKLALFLPTGWMMDAMHKLMVFQDEWTSALPHLLGMLLCAWILGLVAARSFRFE